MSLQSCFFFGSTNRSSWRRGGRGWFSWGAARKAHCNRLWRSCIMTRVLWVWIRQFWRSWITVNGVIILCCFSWGAARKPKCNRVWRSCIMTRVLWWWIRQFWRSWITVNGEVILCKRWKYRGFRTCWLQLSPRVRIFYFFIFQLGNTKSRPTASTP